MTRILCVSAFLHLCIALAVPSLATAQNVTEWSSETRTILAFRVNSEALQKMLPAGWVSAPSAAPASPGANLNVTMMERTVVLDPSGKPVRSGTSRYVVLGAPARSAAGQANTIIISGLSIDAPGAYGVYLPATTATLTRTVTGAADLQPRVQEAWEFGAASGDRLQLQVTFTRGPVSKAHADTVVRSALKPEFQRTYRIDQATDIVRGTGVNDRVEQLVFKATGPKLALLFDGTEALLSVSSVPFYTREISVP